MGKIRVLAGDIAAQTLKVTKVLLADEDGEEHRLGVEVEIDGEKYTVTFRELLKSATVQTEQSVRTLVGTAGWAVAGAILAGPVGAILGGVFGHKKDQVCFVGTLHDDRTFLAVTDAKQFQKIRTGIFNPLHPFSVEEMKKRSNDRLQKMKKYEPAAFMTLVAIVMAIIYFLIS